MSVLIKKSNKYPNVVKNAYSIMVEYRRLLEDIGDYARAEQVELAYKELWCEALNEKHPWG